MKGGSRYRARQDNENKKVKKVLLVEKNKRMDKVFLTNRKDII